MKNPIFEELIKLKLISKKNLITLSNRTKEGRSVARCPEPRLHN